MEMLAFLYTKIKKCPRSLCKCLYFWIVLNYW